MFMIACLYNGFLLSAGHVRRTSLSYVSTTGTLQEGSHVGTAFISFHFGLLGFQCLFFFGLMGLYFLSLWLLGTMDLWAFMYQKGIAKVSLRVSLWDWRECGKKGTTASFACKHEWTNCISRYCKVPLLVVHHIAFVLEPLSRQSASQEDYMKSLAA